MTGKTPPKPKGRSRDMSDADIATAATLYRAGTGSLATLADKFGVSVSTIKRHFKRKGVRKTEATVKEIEERIEAAVTTDLIRAQRENAEKIINAKENVRRGAEFLQRLTLKITMDAVRQGHKPSTTTDDMRAILLASQILKNTKDIQFDALNIINEGNAIESELPELMIKVMGEEDIKAVQQAKNDLGDDALLPNPEIPDLDADDIITEGEPKPGKAGA